MIHPLMFYDANPPCDDVSTIRMMRYVFLIIRMSSFDSPPPIGNWAANYVRVCRGNLDIIPVQSGA